MIRVLIAIQQLRNLILPHAKKSQKIKSGELTFINFQKDVYRCQLECFNYFVKVWAKKESYVLFQQIPDFICYPQTTPKNGVLLPYIVKSCSVFTFQSLQSKSVYTALQVMDYLHPTTTLPQMKCCKPLTISMVKKKTPLLSSTSFKPHC